MQTFTKLTFLAFTLLCIGLPQLTLASHAKPGCTLRVTTTAGTMEVSRNDTVLVARGDEIHIAWESERARYAYDSVGNKIARNGGATSTPVRYATHSYRFTSGSNSVTCAMKTLVVSGTIASKTTTTSSGYLKINGKTSGTNRVSLQLFKDGVSKPVYTSKTLTVRNGSWSTTVPRKLVTGVYTAVLSGSQKYVFNTIATSTLEIGVKASVAPLAAVIPTKPTTFVAQVVPLLSGGVLKVGSSVPIMYLQVINIGASAGVLKNLVVAQNGSLPANAVIGFTVSDDQSPLPLIIGTETKPVTFVGKAATIPLNLSIPAGEMRLYTIKAVTSNKQVFTSGTQLKVDVTALGVNGSLAKTLLPLRGVTWTVGY